MRPTPVHDRAYFQSTVLVAPGNNVHVPTYPWLFASFVSVASHTEKAPYTFYDNPHSPVEFSAPGVDLEVPRLGGRTMVSMGNSYAAPHIVDLVARHFSRHRGLTPFQVKTVLNYTAANVRRVLRAKEEGEQ